MKEKRTATRITVGEDAESPTIYRLKKTGRNKPCPCGSGEKYKNCCMGKEDGLYGYRKLRLKVTREEDLKKKRHFPFEINEIVLTSDKFPVESFRGKEVLITDRGFEEHIATYYFKIDVNPDDDPNHLVDTSQWYADGHLCKPEDYGEEENDELS